MSDIIIKKPELNSEKVEKNIAVIDTWIHDTADKLNFFLSKADRTGETEEDKQSYEKIRAYVQQALNQKPDAERKEKIIGMFEGSITPSTAKLIDASETIKMNKTYYVRWNEKVYTCIPATLQMETYERSYIGNPFLIPEVEEEDTGEPFAFFLEEGQTAWTLMAKEAQTDLEAVVFRKVYELSEDLLVDTVKGYLEGNADTADRLKTARHINGILFDGSEDIGFLATCTTAADVAEKSVRIPNFDRSKESVIVIRFAYGNTADGVKLNVNGNVTAYIYDGEEKIAADVIKTKKAYMFLWTGTLWVLVQ